MRLAVRARELREEARLALLAGSEDAALLARRAHRLHATPRSAALWAVGSCAAGRRGETIGAAEEAARLAADEE